MPTRARWTRSPTHSFPSTSWRESRRRTSRTPTRTCRKGIRWRPKDTDVFAGKLDYPSYRFADRLMIRLIMLITGGPTDPRTVVEFTDWQRVDAFARRVISM